MKLINFNLTKLDLEKKSDNLKNVKLSTNINILEIEEIKSNLFNFSDRVLKIKFEYFINYGEEIAFLRFYGNLLLSIEPEQAKEILEKWKGKKLAEEIRMPLFNIIFRKASIKALQFEEEFNLPPHIPFPSFKNKKE